MPRPPPQSYLLRLWREHAGAPVRATLVPVGRPEAHQHFADLDALCAFLRAQAGEEPGVHAARRRLHVQVSSARERGAAHQGGPINLD